MDSIVQSPQTLQQEDGLNMERDVCSVPAEKTE